MHWRSKYTQYKRFEILTYFIKNHIKDSTIVDAGCGFAEYYSYLRKNNLIPKEYIGIDIEEDMINLAKKRFSDIKLLQKDILNDEIPKADYYICSGAMNILEKEEMFLFIRNSLEASNKGFIFNFLKADSFNNVSANEILTYCKNLSKEISIKDNYLDNDITILLKKPLLD